MKVTITAPGSNQTPFVLADDTNANAMFVQLQPYPNGVGGPVVGDNGFIPDLTVATQADELIDAPEKQELPRGNAQTSWQFTVNRQAVSQDAALMFLADHPPLVPLSGTLALYIGNTVRYLKNAVNGGIRCQKQKGTDLSLTYTFRGSYVAPVYGASGTGTGGTWTAS